MISKEERKSRFEDDWMKRREREKYLIVKISSMYTNDKMSVEEIADSLFGNTGIGSIRAISGIMQECHISLRDSERIEFVKPCKQELEDLYRIDRMPPILIAKKFNVPEVNVHIWLSELKIQLHRPGELYGRLSPNWQGGITDNPYCHKFNDKLREAVRGRDNYECQNCGKSQEENGKKLSVHHVHYDKDNCYPDLITLCSSCHTSSSGDNRDEWEDMCMYILERRGLLNWSISQSLS